MELKEEGEAVRLVLDIGGGTTKIGYAGSDSPLCQFASICLDHRQALPASVLEHTEATSADLLVGNEARKALAAAATRTGSITVLRPYDRGEVTGWEALARILQHALQQVRADAERTWILLTVAPTLTLATRKRLAALLFEKGRAERVCLANSSVAALLATGRTTGLVCEMGDTVTHVVPVFQGFALPHAVLKAAVGGNDVTKRLLRLLNEQQMRQRKTSKGGSGAGAEEEAREEQGDFQLDEHHLELVRDIKEKLCYVRVNPDDEAEEAAARTDSRGSSSGGDSDGAGSGASESDIYELPDGQLVAVGPARYEAGELLFNPRLADLPEDTPSIPRMIYEAAMMCDPSLRQTMFNNIVVAGGASMLKGLPERLEREVQALLANPPLQHPSTLAASAAEAKAAATALAGLADITARVVTDSQRGCASWIGGSILASLPTYPQLCITQDEWKAGNVDAKIGLV